MGGRDSARALTEVTKNWKVLTEGGVPYAVTFNAEGVREAMKLDEVQREADKALELCQNMVGCGPEGWVPIRRA